MKRTAYSLPTVPATMVVAGLLLSGCEDAPQPPPPTTATVAPVTTAHQASPEEQALLAAITENAEQQLRKLAAQAEGFSDSVDGLLTEPEADRLTTAQLAWEHLYGSYNEARVLLSCRALADPLQRQRLTRTDPLPILPGYIDGLHAWPGSGLVNDITVPLNREALMEQQGATSEAEASIGFQVLQFLLFGEPDHPRTADAFLAPEPQLTDIPAADTADAEMMADGDAGTNDEAEMVDVMSLEDHPQRRRQLLRLVATLLVEDLQLLGRTDQPWALGGQDCPARALAESTRRLLQLENLSDHGDVSGEYLAAGARDIARAHLWSGISPWLTEESALLAWADTHAPSAATQLRELGTPETADVSQLQRLHAALTTITGGH